VHKLQTLFHSEGFRQSVFFTLGNLLAYGISAVALLLISKHLGPVQFAEFWLAVAFMTILGKLETLGIPIALQKLVGKVHTQHEHVQSVFFHSFILVLISCSIGTGLGALIGYALSLFLQLSSPELLIAASCCAGVTALFEVLTTYHQATHCFSKAMSMLILQSMGKLAIATLFLLSVQMPLVVVFTLFYLMPLLSVGVGLLQVCSKKGLYRHINVQQFGKILEIAPHATVMAVGIAVMDYLDVFFLKKYGSSVETGLYSGVSQFALGVSVIAQAVGSVLAARVSRYHHWDDLSAYLKKVPFFFIAIGISFLLFIPISFPLVELTLGKSYTPAVPLLVGLIAAALLFAATLPLAAILYIEDERSDYFSVSTGLMLCIQIVGGVLIIPRYGASGAVVIRILSRVVVLVYSLVAVAGFLRRKYSAVRSNPS